MFSFFKKKDQLQRQNDLVYISRAVADEMLVKYLEKNVSQQAVVLLYFFDETLKRLQHRIPAMTMLKAEKLMNDLASRSAVKAKPAPMLVFAEHYPLSSTEDAVLAEIGNIFGEEAANVKVQFYTALDEPMMKIFGADKIIDLVKKMGMKDDEAIAHTMVTKSIHNAQEKLNSKVTAEIRCNSAEEWMKVNVPQ
jgi:hypothetical protein